jgi:hypothetical protein
MENFLIHSDHTIHKYDYECGELDFINEYQLKEFVKAENAKDALFKFVNNVLCYSIDIDEIELNEYGNFSFDILIDAENEQASIENVEEWKKGECILYNDYISLNIYQLNKITEL